MAMPTDVPIIDLMFSIPSNEAKRTYDFMRPLFRDPESLKSFDFPAEYMFRDVPKFEAIDDRVKFTLDAMDKHNIEKALIGVSLEDEVSQQALRDHPDRFLASTSTEPNRGMEDIRDIVRLHEEYDLKAISAFPAGCVPQVPIDDKRFYPVYAKCCELDIPIFCCVGVPGPRIPMACQHVERIDEVMWFFPELKFVMRHGAEPWEDLAVKLMLKWPNLYYSTSAFAPKHYPKAIIDYANTRGADKILYAGYFPMGLSLERIMGDMPNVPFRDHVWPKFLRENAMKVLGL